MNRPPIQEIDRVDLPEPIEHRLDNGIPVYDIRMGTEEVIKLEIVFQAGRPYERKRLVSRTTAAQLSEGTDRHTGLEIAETLDFFGASLRSPVNLDNSGLTLYTLKKHFSSVFPLVEEMLTRPAFPPEELDGYARRNKQRLLVDLNKNDVVAYRTITEKIFGAGHYYGYNSQPADYDQLCREDLLTHFQRNYTAGACRIFISGKTDDTLVEALNREIGKALPTGLGKATIPPAPPIRTDRVVIEKPDSVQTAIRVGRHLFNRSHPDYCGMYVLNAILGGYFGSRLMTNIREEKGYTYNIYSSLDPMRFDGCFFIGTEVGSDFVDETLAEIRMETERLQQDLVPDDEMLMVRRYLMGTLLTMLDGPFSVAGVVRSLITEDSGTDHFRDLANTVREISREEIRRLAQEYLSWDQMWEVIVGQAPS